MISGIANIEKANVISDAVAVSLYLDFRPTKYFSQYPLPSTLKKIEIAAMSDDELTDEELTLEEERQLQKLKEESKPLENLAFLISRTRGFEGLLKKDRKRKEAKRQKEKLKTENSMSPTAQDETFFPGSSSNQEPSDRTETATPPLHVVSNT